MKTTKQYESKLKKLIADRTGSAYEPWMDLTVRSAAMCLVTLDKMQEELEKAPFVIMETNSQGTQKTLPNPLVATYKDMQRTMIMYYESLGLTYKNDPTRINTSAKKENEDEGATGFLKRLNG
jgi:hypothetical protein